MRVLCLLAIAALLALNTQHPARADEIPADAEALRACVAAATKHEALRQCQGVSARACFEAEGQGTNQDILCWSAEGDTWAEMSAEIEARLDADEPERAEHRRAAQIAWTAWAEAECEYRAWEPGGGVGETVVRSRCSVDLTVERAITLIEVERAR